MGTERLRYRAKSKQTGQWFYGFPRKTALGNWLMYCEDKIENIDPDTIGQYIGIDDRDGNGIFEGDIIRIGRCSALFEIRYNPRLARYQAYAQGSPVTRELKAVNSKSYEIVGNIHEKVQTK